VSEHSEARGSAEAPLVRVPVELVEFEAALAQLERRVSEHEARDRPLLEVAERVRRLTEALGPLLELIRPLVEEDGARGELPRGLPHL
jgi:hypothetical protein